MALNRTSNTSNTQKSPNIEQSLTQHYMQIRIALYFYFYLIGSLILAVAFIFAKNISQATTTEWTVKIIRTFYYLL